MEEYLSQMIHSGNRKEQENATTPAENVQPRPGPPLFYKVLAPSLLDRFCSTFDSRRGNQFVTKSESFKSVHQTV